MRRVPPFVLILPVLLILAAVAAAAQARPGRLAGQVLSASGQPVPGAEVVVEPPDGAAIATATDADGRFEVDVEQPGTYRVTARAAGFSPALEQVVATTGAVPELTLVLPEIVRERVNVVGHSRAAERIPGSATIINPSEMERIRLATDDVHQMLRRVPGLNIQEEEAYGLRPNIGMRGTGTDRSSKITLMEDGVLIAPAPYAAPAAYYSPIAGRMESLEVRKGSSQIKYGPITTGGVLNYVSTSIPSDLQVRANLTAGADQLRKLTASVGDSYSNVGWLVETFQFDTDGFKRLDGGGDTGVELEDYLAKFRVNSTPTPSLYQELEIKLGRTEQLGDETYLGLTDADFGATPFRRYAASQADVFDSAHEQYQARHFLARRTWDLTTIAYRNEFRRSWYKLQSVLGSGLAGVLADPAAHGEQMAVLTGADSAADALVVRDNNRSYYGSGLQSALNTSFSTRGVAHQVEVGARYHQDEEDRFQHDDGYRMLGGRMIRTTAGAPGSQANQISAARAIAVFVADTISWGRWRVSPGLRYENIDLERTRYATTDPARTGAADVHETAVNAVIPGLGVSYEIRPDVSVFGGVHRGFAPPAPGAARGTRVEESVNYEAGTRLQRGAASAEIVGFFNDYANLLGRDSLATGGSGDGDLFNGGKARVYGLEASAQWNPAQALGLASALPVRVAYTLTHAEFRSAFESDFGPWGSVRIGDELPYVPSHQLFASVETDHRRWRARLEAALVGRMRTVAGQGGYVPAQSTDSYAVLNLSGEYRLTDGAHLFASVQNLADSVHIVARHPAGVRPGIPRLVQAGVRIALGGQR